MNPLQLALVERADGEIASNRNPETENARSAALAVGLPAGIAEDLRHLWAKLAAECTGVEDKKRAIEAIGNRQETPP